MRKNKFNFFTGESKAFSWWWFGIKVGIVAALIVIWWLENRNKPELSLEKASLAEGKSIPLPVDEISTGEMPPPKKSEPQQPDDLQKIEGIGPKIHTTLQAAGFTTFSQIATLKPVEIKQVLVAAGIRLGDPTTWPEQAALAADGNWEDLKALQASLKGGRR